MMYETKLKAPGYSLERTLDCGQAFRWRRDGDGWFGVALDRPLLIKQNCDELTVSAPSGDAAFWSFYLGLDRDYTEMEALLQEDERTAVCLPYSRGIRILRQNPYEALISFVISANNNVKRISGIIERVCAAYGEKGEHEGREYYAFPRPERLAAATVDELYALGTGYRAPYIISCAQRVADGYDLEALRDMTFDQAKKELLTFLGVGPKVAECVMLFSLDFDRAFPVDVWVKRISQYLYPGEEGRAAAAAAAKSFGSWAGAAQQYLFHYARTVGLKLK